MAAEAHDVNRRSAVAAAALLTSICLVPAMLMPYLVGAIAQTVTADPRRLGFVAGAVLGGPIVVMASSVFWVREYNWRVLVLCGATIAAVGFMLAGEMRGFAPMVSCIAIASSGLAIAYAPAICALSDTANPDRNFGYAFFLQIVVSALTGFAATALDDRFGPRSLFGLIAALFLLSLVLLPLLPSNGVKHRAVEAVERRSPAYTVWMGLAGMLLLNAAPTAVWAFFERIGLGAGLSEHSVGNIIALALLIGAPGSLLSSSAARRFGRLAPLIVSTLLMTGAFVVAIASHDRLIYFFAAALFQFLLNFGLSFQYGALSVADVSGRLIVLAPTFQGVGGIAGPAIAGMLVHGDSYVSVVWLSTLYELVGLALLVGLCKRAASARVGVRSHAPL